MSEVFSIVEARKKIADIINKVVYGNESIILTRRGEKVAAVISIEELEILQHLEEQIDIADARKAVAEGGENIKSEDFWAELGL